MRGVRRLNRNWQRCRDEKRKCEQKRSEHAAHENLQGGRCRLWNHASKMTFKTGVFVAVVLALAFIVYRSCAGRSLNVDPDAREEIEKAKRR